MYYWILRFLILIVLKIFFRLKIEGRENIPKKTNFIVVSNHISFLDPFILAASFPQKIHFLAARFLYNISFIAWWLKHLEAIPTGRKAAKKGVELLLKNKNIGLFPEATCSRDGKLREFRKGVALFSLLSGRPVVCCYIKGADKVLPPSAKFIRSFTQIKVKINKPLFLTKINEEEIDEFKIQERLKKIRDEVLSMQ